MTYPQIADELKRNKAAEQLRLWRSTRDAHRNERQDSHTLIKVEILIATIKAYRYALMLLGTPPPEPVDGGA